MRIQPHLTMQTVPNGGYFAPYPRPAVTIRDVGRYRHAPTGAAKVSILVPR
jgi:hypothetical protein